MRGGQALHFYWPRLCSNHQQPPNACQVATHDAVVHATISKPTSLQQPTITSRMSLPSTKRIGSLDLRALLQAQTAREIKMGQPRELACWTRTSITHGLQTHYADRSGLHPFACMPAPGEASLADGYPNEFTRKPQGNEPCGVETIINAAQQVCDRRVSDQRVVCRSFTDISSQAKVSLAQYDIVTYRNNLNKIFNTVRCNALVQCLGAVPLPSTGSQHGHPTALAWEPSMDSGRVHGGQNALFRYRAHP